MGGATLQSVCMFAAAGDGDLKDASLSHTLALSLSSLCLSLALLLSTVEGQRTTMSPPWEGWG